jgi:hypothetical protein
MMKLTNHDRRRSQLRATISAALLALVLSGCATFDESIAISQETVLPINAGDTADVSALDLAEAMLRAGFQPPEILLHGPAVRNALAEAGGAQVRSGGGVQAMMTIHADRLYVASRTRGTFIIPLGARGRERVVSARAG